MLSFDPRNVRDVDVEFVPPVDVPIDYFVDRCLEWLTRITAEAEPHVRQQALALQHEMRQKIDLAMRQARRADRFRLAALLHKQGENDLARFIETQDGEF